MRWLRQLGLRNTLFGVSSLSLLLVLAAIWFYVSHDARLLAAIHRGDEAGVLGQLWRTLMVAMVGGFLLNNQLTDFSFQPKDKDGSPAANAVGPRRRPRSSMSPVIVLDRQGRFVAAVGSPGGLAIPAYVLKSLVGVLDWKLSMQEAVALPNLIAFGDFYVAETDKFAPGVVDGLKGMGMTLRGGFAAEGSGLHGVMVKDGALTGGADPRREGVAAPCC